MNVRCPGESVGCNGTLQTERALTQRDLRTREWSALWCHGEDGFTKQLLGEVTMLGTGEGVCMGWTLTLAGEAWWLISTMVF